MKGKGTHDSLAESMAILISLLEAAGGVTGRSRLQSMVYILQYVIPELSVYKFKFPSSSPKSEDLVMDLSMLVASGLIEEGWKPLLLKEHLSPVFEYSTKESGTRFLQDFECLHKRTLLDKSFEPYVKAIAGSREPDLQRACLQLHRESKVTNLSPQALIKARRTGKKIPQLEKNELGDLLKSLGIDTTKNQMRRKNSKPPIYRSE